MSFSEPFIFCVCSINLKVIETFRTVDRTNILDVNKGQRDCLIVVNRGIFEVVESSPLKTAFRNQK